MTLSFWDTFSFTFYLMLIAGIGVYYAKRNQSTEAYFVGNRSFPGWALGLSLVGTSISSISFLAYPGDAYKTAWLRFIPNLMLPIAIAFAAVYFLPHFRQGKHTTAYQYLEGRFGPSVRSYAAIAFIVGQVVRVSIILYLVSLVVHELTGFSPELCILIAGSFVAAYTIVGGIEAVIWTDVLQTVVLVLGGILCLVTLIYAIPGGLTEIVNTAVAANKLSFSELQGGTLTPIAWGISLSEKTGTMMLLLGLTLWLTEYSGNQNTIQRFCAAKSMKEAKKAMFICAASSLPIWAFFMFLGTALYVFFQLNPTIESQEMLNGARKAEEILPYFVTHYLPKGLVGIVLAAMLAAAMSSLDSSLNAISTVSVKDIYQRHINTHANDKHYLWFAKAIATITAAIMMIGAYLLYKADTKTLQDTATILVSLLSSGILGIYLLGFFSKRGNAGAIWVGISSTLMFTGWTLLSKYGTIPSQLSVPFDLYYTALLSNLVMLVTSYSATYLKPFGRMQQPREALASH